MILNKECWSLQKKEIKEHSDLHLTYEVIKEGKTPSEIRFTVTRPAPGSEEIRLNAQDEAVRYHSRVSTGALEKAKTMAALANTGWDIYAIEEQFYSFMKSKGAPKNIDGAFIGFVKKKIISPPR